MVRQTPASFLTEETQWHLSSSIPWQKTDVVGRVLKQLRFGFKENRTKTGHPFCSSKRSSGRSNHLILGPPSSWTHRYFSESVRRTAPLLEPAFQKPSPRKRSGNKNVPAKPKDPGVDENEGLPHKGEK